jgi:hypothetical protein
MFALNPHSITQTSFGLNTNRNYLTWVRTNITALFSQYATRIRELDVVLADPSVKGKERKKIRQRRLRTIKSQDMCVKDIDAINNALLRLDTGLAGPVLPHVAAISQYFPPLLNYPQPLHVLPGPTVEDATGMPGSWTGSCNFGWESPGKYSWSSGEWIHGPSEPSQWLNSVTDAGVSDVDSSYQASTVSEPFELILEENSDQVKPTACSEKLT